MSEQNLTFSGQRLDSDSVKDEPIDLANEKQPSRDAIKQQRISRLQQILIKNVKLRQDQTQNKTKVKYPLFNIDRPVKKRSLPSIKITQNYDLGKVEQEKTEKNNLTKKDLCDEASLLGKYRISLAFNNPTIRNALKKYEPIVQSSFRQENQQSQSPVSRHYLKLKVKDLHLIDKKNPQCPENIPSHSLQKLHPSQSRSSITSLKTLEKSIIQKLSSPTHQNSKEMQQKLQRRNLRQRKREASLLNLTKIEHLPQIIFPKNKKCSRPKFPSLSMAQVDHNLLTNEILGLEENRLIEQKERSKKERLFQEKIRLYKRFNSIEYVGE